MSSLFKITQTVYMIASNRIVQPVVVKKISEDGSMYLVGFERSGAFWVHEDRLFSRKEDAETYLKHFKKERRGVRKYRDKLH